MLLEKDTGTRCDEGGTDRVRSKSKDWTTAWDLDVHDMLPANVADELRRMFGLIATRRLGEVALVVSADPAWCEDCERMVPTVEVVADLREGPHEVEWEPTTGVAYCEGCASTVWALSEDHWRAVSGEAWEIDREAGGWFE